MCSTCGCGGHDATIGKRAGYRTLEHRPILASTMAGTRAASLSHETTVTSRTAHARIVEVERDLLAQNDALARANRHWLAERGIFAVNLVSSPGSGKTTLLARTIEAWKPRTPVYVIEGDQQTSLDAERIRATGAPALQVNTGKGCHLDARMIAAALAQLDPLPGSLLFIENVGNLVCPAAFDLGEAHKVVILSVTEGDDKPLKYPDLFAASDMMLVNKIDLAPHVDFDVARAVAHARRVRPDLDAVALSARTGEGFDRWIAWLARGAQRCCAVRVEVAAHPGAWHTALPSVDHAL